MSTSQIKVDFIDPLYALAIGAGFQVTVMEWKLDGSAPTSMHVAVAIFALLNLVLSWYGYHESIKQNPLRGSLRFILDIVLVLLYATIFVYYEDVRFVVLLLAIIQALFWVWDRFKACEYKRETDSGSGDTRSSASLVWMFVSMALLAYAETTNRWAPAWWSEWVALGLGYLIIIGFRVHKLSYDRDSATWDVIKGLKLFCFGK